MNTPFPSSPSLDIANAIAASVQDAVRAVEVLKTDEGQAFIEHASLCLAQAFHRGNKLLIAGNGGSLCDAMHVAEEFTGFFRSKRLALPAIALSDPAHMSCVANDTSFYEIFSRGIEAYGKAGDIFIALTTSGNSENLVQAVKTAKEKGLTTIAFLGKSGGVLKGACDLEFIVQGFSYSDRIQEVHMAALHIIIEMVERYLFPSLYAHSPLPSE